MTTPNIVTMRNEFNPFCVHQLFEDCDQWTEAFSTWNLTATQLSQGKFKGELAIAQFGCYLESYLQKR